MKYHTETLSLIVKPEGEPIFSEMATRVYLEDEAAGPFVVVEQQVGKISINPEEWEELKAAIDTMMEKCKRLEGK